MLNDLIKETTKTENNRIMLLICGGLLLFFATFLLFSQNDSLRLTILGFSVVLFPLFVLEFYNHRDDLV